ncbi:HTH-type sugar sensing transcriptional regulator TrmBL1 [Candidatus Anstonella stagnisolia]|nr:HTH-type sugar sensing transcriptional regulator TrmBL1 [Candidatus Anstonella stagnisolia]
MDASQLEKAGLSPSESKVYFVLLHIGVASISEITQRSGVHRRNVYDALDRLISKSLVSYFLKNKKKYYQAENPGKLIELVKEKEKRLLLLLPQLQAIHEESVRPTVRIVEGKEGAKEVFNDILRTLKKGEHYCVFGVTGNAFVLLGDWYKNYLRRRREKGIRTRAIFNYGVKYSEASKLPLASVRFLPKKFKSFVATFIYANKVAQVIWGDEPPPSIGIIIENEQFARTYGNYFEWMWKISTK